MTRQGANSTFLQDTIDRLSKALEIEKDQAIAASIALSIDNAHANHPNHPRDFGSDDACATRKRRRHQA